MVLWHLRSYVYSVARECDNGKVDSKVVWYWTNLLSSCFLLWRESSIFDLLRHRNLIIAPPCVCRIAPELFFVQPKEQHRLLYRSITLTLLLSCTLTPLSGWIHQLKVTKTLSPKARSNPKTNFTRCLSSFWWLPAKTNPERARDYSTDWVSVCLSCNT